MIKLVIFVRAKVKQIFRMGKDYLWSRPKGCPRCKGNRLWGHGYVLAYFDGFSDGIYLRRYRCPDCGCVIRLRPAGYFARFQAPIADIRFRILHRLQTGRWPPGLSRSRQDHWFRAFLRRVEAFLGRKWNKSLSEAFDYFLMCSVHPVSRSI